MDESPPPGGVSPTGAATFRSTCEALDDVPSVDELARWQRELVEDRADG